MPLTVHVPAALSAFTEGRTRVEVDRASNVGEALAALAARHPGVRDRVLTEQGQVRPHVNVFVGEESIRYTGGLETPVAEGDEVFIIAAVSGGAPAWVALAVLALARVSAGQPVAASPTPSGPPPVSCTIAPDKARPISASGREVFCAIDMGSRNVKLVVNSMSPGKPLTLRDDRSCRARLNLGAKVYDAKAPAGKQDRPVPSAALDDLVAVVKELQAICALDGGRMVGADATEWARHATNIKEVAAGVAGKTGIAIDVLTPDQEALYGYVAATRNTPGRIVVDPGSNSFQITWQVPGEAAPQAISIPLGYEQAGKLHFMAADTYERGRSRYVEDIRKRLAAAPGFATLRAAVAAGKLGRAILSLGQDGAIDRVVRGALRDAEGRWIADEAAYNRATSGGEPLVSEEYGAITALLEAAEVARYVESLKGNNQLAQLQADPIRGLYGNKALVVPALIDFLATELKLGTIVVTPQEMPTGYILVKRATPR